MISTFIPMSFQMTMIPKILRLLLIFPVLIFSSIPGVFGSGLPAISDNTGDQLAGRFVWFDLLTNDPGKAGAYYEELFDWDINKAEGFPGYELISNQGLMIGGISEIGDDELPAWLGLFSMANVPMAVDKVRQLGGGILEPAQDVEGRGTMAIVEDNAGAAFVLIDTGLRDPETRPIRTGDWIWTDLFTKDTDEAGKFYEGLAGLKLQTFKDKEGNEFDLLMAGNKARSAVVEIAFEKVTPIWLPYVRVSDIEATIERSSQLGGKLFYKYGDGAILLDPTGAAIGVQQVSKRGG